MAKKQAEQKTEVAEVQALDIRKVTVSIKGMSPIIFNRWSEKALQQMLDKQMKKTNKNKNEAKDPDEQFKDSIYRLEDGRPGFPADGFKKAMIRGCKPLGLTMTDMRGGFFVHGLYSQNEDRELVPIEGEISKRSDPVRISGGSDIRFRGQITEWRADLEISYHAAVVSFDHIVNMLNAAGFGVGIGDWRPERDGGFGRFQVVTE